MAWDPSTGVPPDRVLLIQLRRIGDAVLLTPALDGLRAAWPETKIHLLTEDPIPQLFLGDPRIDIVWPRPPRRDLLGLARALRRERYDLCFDFQSLPWTAVLARSLRALTVGFQKRGRTRAYHRGVRLSDHRGSEYAADHKLDLLRAVGLSPQLPVPRIMLRTAGKEVWAEAGDRARVVLVPVSRRPHKRWTAAAFAETARRIHEATGAFVLVAGGPGEREPLETVSDLMETVPHRVKLCLDLNEFAAVLGHAHLFLGNDNGPRHLAIALGTPTLAWFGPQNPTHWTPPGDPRHPVIWNPDRAHGRSVRDGLNRVDDNPEAAAAAGAAVLRARLEART